MASERAVGFSLVLILFASMRERIAAADVPAPFKGASIAMITAGLMSLALYGLHWVGETVMTTILIAIIALVILAAVFWGRSRFCFD